MIQAVLFAPPPELPVWKSRFGYSTRLVLFAAVIAAGLGIPLGVVSAARHRSAWSHAISVGLAALIAIPNFVLGLLAIVVLASHLKLISVLPDWNQPSDWIVPAIVLAVMPMASIARVTSSALTNIMQEDYIRTAHGKGLSRGRVLGVHVLRNALIPILTFMGPALMEMFTGLLVIENLYAFPGLGREFWEAVLALDYPMILGLTLVYATGIIFVNMLIDVVAEMLDPRVRKAKIMMPQ
jgi:oligopeptide transport system permease protein